MSSPLSGNKKLCQNFLLRTLCVMLFFSAIKTLWNHSCFDAFGVCLFLLPFSDIQCRSAGRGSTQWRRFLLEIGGTNAKGTSVDRRRHENRGSRVCGGGPPPHWGRCPSPDNFSIFELKRRVLVHSECYFCS